MDIVFIGLWHSPSLHISISGDTLLIKHNLAILSTCLIQGKYISYHYNTLHSIDIDNLSANSIQLCKTTYIGVRALHSPSTKTNRLTLKIDNIKKCLFNSNRILFQILECSVISLYQSWFVFSPVMFSNFPRPKSRSQE